MIEILNLVLWVIGLLTSLGIVGLAVAWIVTYVMEWYADVAPSVKAKAVMRRAGTCHRWLAGFDDLDIVWDYIFNGGDIDQVRTAYAKARNTDVYGRPLSGTQEDTNAE